MEYDKIVSEINQYYNSKHELKLKEIELEKQYKIIEKLDYIVHDLVDKWTTITKYDYDDYEIKYNNITHEYVIYFKEYSYCGNLQLIDEFELYDECYHYLLITLEDVLEPKTFLEYWKNKRDNWLKLKNERDIKEKENKEKELYKKLKEKYG